MEMRINRARRMQYSKTFVHQAKNIPLMRGGRRVF